MGKVLAACAAVALTGGIWLLAGAAGAPPWLQTALTVMLGGAFALVALLELIWQATGEDVPRRPDPAVLDAFERMSLHAVRTRADQFERDAENAPKKAAYAYRIPAGSWRDLEKEMRQEGALEVGDLRPKAVARWAKWLDVAGEAGIPASPVPLLEDREPKVATAKLRHGHEWLAKLRVSGHRARSRRRRRN